MKKLNLVKQLNKQLIVAIHCTDLQQAEIVLSFAAELGFKTDAIQSPLILKKNWNEHKKQHSLFFKQYV